MTMPLFFESIQPQGILSFAPDSEAIPLGGLNVLIGPNGSGKSNLLEVISLLRAVPVDLAGAIRAGGGTYEWRWKGEGNGSAPEIKCILQFSLGEILVDRIWYVVEPLPNVQESIHSLDSQEELFSSFSRDPFILESENGELEQKRVQLGKWNHTASVLTQVRDAARYNTVTWLGSRLLEIAVYQDSSFGRFTAFRQPQPADLPNDILLPDGRNLGLVLNSIEHRGDWKRMQQLLKRFLPRFERLSMKVEAGTVQVFLHESGLQTPTPAVRLSDGTLRFLGLMAILLSPAPAPLICIDEPEMGLHPDAIQLLAELFVDASERTQLIVTTHSDVLVSALTEHAESVLVCENNGGTTIKALESEKLKFWLDRYRLGDLWRMGELGGNT